MYENALRCHKRVSNTLELQYWRVWDARVAAGKWPQVLCRDVYSQPLSHFFLPHTWQFLTEAKHSLPTVTVLLRIYTKELKQCTHKYLHNSFYWSCIHDSPKLGSSQNDSWGMEKGPVVPYNTTLVSDGKKVDTELRECLSIWSNLH